jgi:hypothetical protein
MLLLVYIQRSGGTIPCAQSATLMPYRHARCLVPYRHASCPTGMPYGNLRKPYGGSKYSCNNFLLDRVFVEYVITWLWVRAGSYYIGYVSSWT